MVVERKFVKDKMREFSVKEYLSKYLERVGFSHIDIQKTPVGFSIIIYSSKPGLIVGRKGLNIREIQDKLQKEFELESPVIEVREVANPDLDPQIVAEKIGTQLLKFGVARFKAIGHKSIEQVMHAGAVGAEIRIGGLVPSSRANFWKFNAGYLPKCGQVAIDSVLKGFRAILIKRGSVGVTVKILPPGLKMPDQVYLKDKNVVQAAMMVAPATVEQVVEDEKAKKRKAPAKKGEAKKRAPRKKKEGEEVSQDTVQEAKPEASA